MAQVGDRVLAFMSVKGDVAYSLGEGVYAGDFIPPAEIGLGFPNPRIDLDNGDTVWGCECWWGPVDKMNSKFPVDKFRREIVHIADFRAK